MNSEPRPDAQSGVANRDSAAQYTPPAKEEPRGVTISRADIRKEVRFAVVLYGGVSLAVYISGVVRELLAMVRATSPKRATPDGVGELLEPDASGSIGVYQRLANQLNRPPREGNGEGGDDQTVYTRFVVDVVSGTSAGGLNGVYLAKALARAQHVDHLRDLWLEVGDIEKLLNSKDHNPRSVLSGATMLKQLYTAFERMETQSIGAANREEHSLVDDVQCFATTTDLAGLPIQLRLADKIVIEDRHRHVFRFLFSNAPGQASQNDFEQKNNGNLAFAARCTSAFPGAFPPAALGDVADVGAQLHEPEKLFPDYNGTAATDAAGGMGTVFDARRHAFADGGILNNKPFGNAISALGSQRGGKPSERKLIYVEPSPDAHDSIQVAHAKPIDDLSKPNFFGVVQTSQSLPGDQTIREDLERVVERNRTIDRIRDLIADLPIEVQRHQALVGAVFKKRSEEGPDAETARKLLRILVPTSSKDAADAFNACDVGDMLQLFGLGYGGYHRLKVAAATDVLTMTVTRLAGFDERSDEFAAIRAVVRAWRDLNFAPYLRDLPESEQARSKRIEDVLKASAPHLVKRFSERKSENVFLFEMDLRYRLRRLDFVLNQIDDLFCLDDRGRLLLNAFKAKNPRTWLTGRRRVDLGDMAKVLSDAYTKLRNAADELDSARGEFAASIGALNIGGAELQTILKLGGSKQEDEAIRMITERIVAFDAMAEQINARVKAASVAASDGVSPALKARPTESPDGEPEPRDIIRSLYDNYESVDRITFPVFYQTNVGEEIDTVGIVRVSPIDASALAPARKLGGETLGHFGGFFSKRWRAIDFLWGQLDAAERIIQSVCMESDEVPEQKRAEFVKEAQVAILTDDANVAGIEELLKFSGDERGQQRYDFLTQHAKELQALPAEAKRTLVVALSRAVPIIGRIAEKGGPGIVGTVAAKAGRPLIFIAESVFERWKGFLLVTLSWLGMAAGLSGAILTINVALPLPHGWPAIVRVLAVLGAVFGGGAVVAAGGFTLYIRRRLRALVEGILPGKPVETGG